MKGVCSYVDAASRIGEIVVPPFAMARTLLTCTDAAIHNSEKRAYLAERRGCRHCRWRDSWCGSYLAAPTGEMHAISLLPLARCMPRKRCHHSFLRDTFTPCTVLKMPQHEIMLLKIWLNKILFLKINKLTVTESRVKIRGPRMLNKIIVLSNKTEQNNLTLTNTILL